MATRKLKNVDSGSWPKVKQGSHLTVKTFEDGHTELVWDDDALLKDVQTAIATYETALNSIELSASVIEKAKRSSKKTVAKKKSK